MKKSKSGEEISIDPLVFNYTIGIVIPVYQKKYIRNLVKQIFKTVSRKDFCICIVNDGNSAVKEYLAKYNWPVNIEILNLSKNGGFAAANNLGWKFLSKKYPTINYLGTLNDDTIPHKNWLDNIVIALENNPNIAMAAPIQVIRNGWFGQKQEYAVFRLGNANLPWVPKLDEITKDTFVPAVSGFCFVANKKALEVVEYFDEIFMNSGEDLDLCLKMITNGWHIIVCKDSRVFHYGGSSRYLSNAKISGYEKIITERWGFDLSCYNKLLIE